MEEETENTLNRVKEILSPMDGELHKGDSGRVGVVGGTKVYTGAPYFSAMAAMLVGADLAHVFCSESAATAITCYSPNVIVHPVMREYSDQNQEETDTPTNEIKKMFSELTALVVGPGLGRDDLMQKTALEVIKEARDHGLPIILSGDALFLMQTNSEAIKGYEKAILTPNSVEFKSLCEALEVEDSETAHKDLAQKLGGVTVVKKGEVDYISNGTVDLEMGEEQSSKCYGGKDDIFSGIMGTLCGWASMASDLDEAEINENEVYPLTAFHACYAARTASKMLEEEKGRGALATDVLSFVTEGHMCALLTS